MTVSSYYDTDSHGGVQHVHLPLLHHLTALPNHTAAPQPYHMYYPCDHTSTTDVPRQHPRIPRVLPMYRSCTAVPHMYCRTAAPYLLPYRMQVLRFSDDGFVRRFTTLSSLQPGISRVALGLLGPSRACLRLQAVPGELQV